MGKKILIIDYDQKSTARISELLTSRGFEIMTAADGQAGWDKFEQGSPDLIIMEPMLSKIHGFELCQKIRNASQGRTPVIILTGIYKDSIYKTEAVKIYGAFQYFEKPVEDGKLLAEIARAVGEDTQDAPTPEDRSRTDAASPTKTAGHKAANREDEIETLLGQALAQAPEPAGKSAAGSENREVDDLLKKALKGFDLEAGKAKPAVKHDKPTVPPVRRESGAGAISGPKPPKPVAPERPVIEDELIRTVRESSEEPDGTGLRPTAKSEVREERRETVMPRAVPKEQPEERPEPSPVIEPAAREREYVPGDTLFGDISGKPEKKKINFKLAAGITGAVVLLIVGLMIFKPASSSEKPAPAEGQAATTENAPVPTPEPPASEPEKAAVGEPLRRNAKPAPKAAKPDRKNEPQPISESGKIARDINVPALTPAAADKNGQAPVGDTAAALKKEPAAADAAGRENPAPAPVPAEPSVPAGNGAAENPGAPPADAAKDTQNTEAPAQADRIPESPAVVPGQLVELSQVARQPEAIKKVSPVYPEIARKFGTAGTVIVNALINEFGVVTDTRILKGIKNDHGLHRAAEDAVKRWKFNPGYIGQVPVKVWLPVTIVFSAGETR